MRRLLTLFISLTITTLVCAQGVVEGTVIDADTRLAIPFASVMYRAKHAQSGVISNLNGRFVIPRGADSIVVSCVGYRTAGFGIGQNMRLPLYVELKQDNISIDEVVVTPLNNPAIPIIRRVLANKEFNNHHNYQKYTYRCYVKTLIDFRLGVDSLGADSAKVKALQKQAGFISESVLNTSKYGSLFENKIIAHRTSGFQDALLPTAFISLFHHSISFYDNVVSLFEMPVAFDKFISEYVSPLSSGCLSSYRYELEDVYSSENDTVFVINFNPKKGSKFNGLMGKLFISSNGYAIKHIVVEPAERSLVVFKFRQDYALVDGRWFPKRLDEEVGWRINGNQNAYNAYVIAATIDSVNLAPAISRADIGLERVAVDEKMLRSSDHILAAARADSLTQRELNTYHFMDSVSSRHGLERWMNAIPKLSHSKFPLGYFDLDLLRLYGYNKHEGNRVGVGLFTSDKLTRYASLGGFVTYGIKSEDFNYGGQLLFHINRYNDVSLRFIYHKGLKEAGRGVVNDFAQRDFNTTTRDYLGSTYDDCLEARAQFGFRIFRNLKVSLSLAARELKPLYSYTYGGDSLSAFGADYFRLTMRYAHGETFSSIGGIRSSSGDGNPILGINFERGLDVLGRKGYTYNRLESTLEFNLFWGRIGQSKFLLSAGYIDADVPFTLLFTGYGSRNSSLPFAVAGSFQTMLPNEFLSDAYANLFYSHNFGSLLINTKHFKPQFMVVHNTGWGALRSPTIHGGIEFQPMGRFYLESGLTILDIFRVNVMNFCYVGLGAGGYYRYGYYTFPKPADNLAVKLALSVTLK